MLVKLFLLAFVLAGVARSESESSSITPNVNSSMDTSCSRSLSRRVRQFLKQELFAQLQINTAELPATCPLNPQIDIFGDQEVHRRESSRNEWRCLYCNKRFVNEFYLDRHMHNHHTDKLILTNESVCLADYCDMFGCRVRDNQNSESDQRQVKKIVTLERCSQEKVNELRAQCELVNESCFKGSATEKAFAERVCGSIRCDKGVFRGGIEMKEEKKSFFIFKLLKYMVVIMLLGAVLLYALLSDIPWLSLLGSKQNEKDLVNLYKKKQTPRWWFADRIVNAIRQGYSDFVKPAVKRQQGKAI